MANITFQPVLREVRDVLNSDYYDIPRFQRPFSWSPENLDDFIQDVVDDNDTGYFIGPMVAYRQSRDRSAIVDGQQRITTITLLLCTLRDIFQEIGEQRLADGLDRYIERPDDDSIRHFVLSSKAAHPYLQSQIQLRPPRRSMAPSNEDQRALNRASSDLRSRMDARIERLSTDKPSEEQPSPAAAELKGIRDKILGLQTIWIQLDTEDDAYVIFETLNSRGMNLEVVDLLKNLILSAIRAENGDLDLAHTRWNEIRALLTEKGGNANANKFILHWWLSRYPYTAERKLFKEIKALVRTSVSAANLLDELHEDAAIYCLISDPGSQSWPRQDAELRDSLEAINIFGVRQPRPLLLALLRGYHDQTISRKTCLRAVQAIESFHFVTTAIVGVSSTGGVSRMYASYATRITASLNLNASGAEVKRFIDRLRIGLSSRDTFSIEFPRALRFSETETISKNLVQYVLKRLQKHQRPKIPIDDARCNIEHLHPQSMGESWAAEIGNLLWLDQNLNQSLSADGFAIKQAALSSHINMYDIDDVVAATKWGEAEVSARSKRLATLSFDEVWKF